MVVTGSWGGEAALAPHQCQVPPGDAVSPGAHSELPVCPPALCIQMRCCPPGPWHPWCSALPLPTLKSAQLIHVPISTSPADAQLGSMPSLHCVWIT